MAAHGFGGQLGFAVASRRLHDTGKIGWWWLLQFMPILQIVCLVWIATDGDVGRNRFSPDPKEG